MSLQELGSNRIRLSKPKCSMLEYISHYRRWHRLLSAESCIRYAFYVLCSLATANHFISLSNYDEPPSCWWPQMVSQDNPHSLVEYLQPHRSTRPDSSISSNIEHLIRPLARVFEMASSQVRLKMHGSLSFIAFPVVVLVL